MSKIFPLLFFFLTLSGHSQTKGMPDFFQLPSGEFFRISQLNTPILFEKVDYHLLHAAIFHLTNQERTRIGIAPLVHSKEIQAAAEGHAKDMVIHRFYSHTSPIKFKRTLRDRLNRQGINPKYIGENISSTFGIQYEEGKKVAKPMNPGEFNYLQASSTAGPIPPHTYHSFAQMVVLLWMNSPPHRQNILNPLFTHLGCGTQVYFDKNFYEMPYFMSVQNFIRK
jgi:uncharacterized protein YkwD